MNMNGMRAKAICSLILVAAMMSGCKSGNETRGFDHDTLYQCFDIRHQAGFMFWGKDLKETDDGEIMVLRDTNNTTRRFMGQGDPYVKCKSVQND